MMLTLIDGGAGCMRDDCLITVTSSYQTMAYYSPMYDKDGVNVNPDRNATYEDVRCLSCGKSWRREHYGTKTNP